MENQPSLFDSFTELKPQEPKAKNNLADLEKKLWSLADQLRANSNLKSAEYSIPVLGLIFLKYADYKFSKVEKELAGKTSGRRQIGKTDYQASGVLYLPTEARFSKLIELPEDRDIALAINQAMKLIEAENEDLKGVLPQNYAILEKSTILELLKLINSIPADIEGDAFGKIYEYFLGSFAMSEGQKGGEFFTPTSIVKLIVEIIEPFHGKILDPACGSGGMFVQSANFVENHKKDPNAEISIYGQEKVGETVRLCKMNLAVHGLSGDVKEAISYYDDPHKAVGEFDFVMANPPFNVNSVDKTKLKDDSKRFPLGMPSVDNANYLWIQIFYSALNERGRAGFVMANSASDARSSEATLRQKLVEASAVDVMVSVGSNFFYTVTLPCTLWFLDKGKRETARKDKVLFIDARAIYKQIDRAHREFTDEQVEFLANIVRLYRGEEIENLQNTKEMLLEKFPSNVYVDIAGLCKVATIDEIAAQGWSLNPGRYVGVTEKSAEDFDFKARLTELNEELESLNLEAHELETQIADNIGKLLEQME
ncbi:MAG: SAM-dependent DNA methyltransferase [Acidobacteria bacterium]|nr:SAM-dependent DNA methyltransferase [Acidobacteriota bacterium]